MDIRCLVSTSDIVFILSEVVLLRLCHQKRCRKSGNFVHGFESLCGITDASWNKPCWAGLIPRENGASHKTRSVLAIIFFRLYPEAHSVSGRQIRKFHRMSTEWLPKPFTTIPEPSRNLSVTFWSDSEPKQHLFSVWPIPVVIPSVNRSKSMLPWAGGR